MASERDNEWPGGQAKGALDEFRKNFVLRQVLEAVDGIDADYMTSEDHHPGYVLIPTAKFEEIRIASNNYNQRAVQSDKANFGRECSYAHPVGTRCPICSDWPYAKGGSAAFNAEQISDRVVQSVSELPDYTSPDDQPDLLQCTVEELANAVNAAIPSLSEHDDDLLDIISDAIDESMDVDWTSRDGARHVLGALQIGGYIRTAAMDALIADSADMIDAPASADALGEVERVARALAKADGLDFDEVCGVDADPDEGYCDSGTCVAAHWEEHDAEQARRRYMHLATAALSAMSPAGEVEKIVAWLRSRADDIAPPETEGSDPLWTVHAFVHGMANQIECGDYRHD